ncbi:ATP-dependent Clp protease adaptor ClpS [Candidatus Sumerlaeota bacterium]|nr:ATP-dependent Clp protease adaptor ClpS [Candidatus Sumerlaeota bacterium]
MSEPMDNSSEAQQPDWSHLNELLETHLSPGEGWGVVLYDDTCHYREDVVHQVMKALQCGAQMADGIVERVEKMQKSLIIITTHAEARRVQTILSEIRLTTRLRRIG